MFENNNKEIIKEVAWEQYKNHKLKNYITIFAIALTTILITAILTAGFSFISTIDNGMEQSPGPEAHGSIGGGIKQYERVLEQDEVEWADYVEICSTAGLHNYEFGGIESRLFAPDDSFYRDNHVILSEGRYPQSTSEILISDTMAKNIGMDSPIGKGFPLDVVILQDGENVEQEIPMKICGVYKNPLYQISSIYEEIYTAQGFSLEFNPELDQDNHIIYVKLNNINPLLLKTDIEWKLADLCDKVGGSSSSAGKNSTTGFSDSLMVVIPVLFLVLLLMCSGYFLIYNVFYISISSEIRWYGMMKTIGTTKKQLKQILNLQMRRMSSIGITVGVIIGYGIGCLIGPRVIGMTIFSVYYKSPPFIIIALLAVFFAYFTVRISARKPFAMAANISSVAAAKYVAPKKKTIFTIISLSLSGSIFLIVMNVVIGFQTDVYINRYNQNDFQVNHNSFLWDIDESYQPISDELAPQIKDLSFVEKVDLIYMARTKDNQQGDFSYESSTGEIKPEGKLYDFYQREYGEGFPYFINEMGNLKLPIFGIPQDRWDTEMANYNIKSGEIDKEKFASGDYIVFQEENNEYMKTVYKLKSTTKEKDRITAGDKLSLSFYDEGREAYIDKEVTVLAVLEKAHDYSSSDISAAVIIMPDHMFKEIYSGYSEKIGGIQIETKEEMTEKEISQVTDLVRQEHNVQLRTASRYQSSKDAESTKITYTFIGSFFVVILGIIGISNIINTVTADIFARRKEYAAMQSIGMTKKQLYRELLINSGKFCIYALLITIPLGGVGAYILADLNLFTGFNLLLYIQSVLCVMLVMLIICAIIAKILTQVLNSKSIVERLREIE